mmetsp:Transcript_92917/g.268325  ORF Transcript_92917/g.268325 Transcript_92917/m.268325 type:complete len:382 (+) Transcript_92917:768-1913(+)
MRHFAELAHGRRAAAPSRATHVALLRPLRRARGSDPRRRGLVRLPLPLLQLHGEQRRRRLHLGDAHRDDHGHPPAVGAALHSSGEQHISCRGWRDGFVGCGLRASSRAGLGACAGALPGVFGARDLLLLGAQAPVPQAVRRRDGGRGVQPELRNRLDKAPPDGAVRAFVAARLLLPPRHGSGSDDDDLQHGAAALSVVRGGAREGLRMLQSARDRTGDMGRSGNRPRLPAHGRAGCADLPVHDDWRAGPLLRSCGGPRYGRLPVEVRFLCLRGGRLQQPRAGCVVLRLGARYRAARHASRVDWVVHASRAQAHAHRRSRLGDGSAASLCGLLFLRERGDGHVADMASQELDAIGVVSGGRGLGKGQAGGIAEVALINERRS